MRIPATKPTTRHAAADCRAARIPTCAGPKNPTAARLPPAAPATSAGTTTVSSSRTGARTRRVVSTAPTNSARAQGTMTAGAAMPGSRAHQPVPHTTTRLPATVDDRSSTRPSRPSRRSIWETKAARTLSAMTTPALPKSSRSATVSAAATPVRVMTPVASGSCSERTSAGQP